SADGGRNSWRPYGNGAAEQQQHGRRDGDKLGHLPTGPGNGHRELPAGRPGEHDAKPRCPQSQLQRALQPDAGYSDGYRARDFAERAYQQDWQPVANSGQRLPEHGRSFEPSGHYYQRQSGRAALQQSYGPGSPSITLTVQGTFKTIPLYYIQALNASGTVTLTATAPGWTSGTLTVELTPS